MSVAQATPRPRPLSAPDPDEPLYAPTNEDVVLYHLVWRALRDGSPGRAPLPPEIITDVAVYAGWLLPCRTRGMVQTSERAHIRCHTNDDSARVSKRWFSTSLTDLDIKGIAAFQLITGSKGQGGMLFDRPSESMSWFEIAIERQGETVSRLQWKSHHNELGRRTMSRVEGAIIQAPQTDWRVGDVVVVWMYAQSYLWSNEAEKGALLFYKWFQPVN